MYLLSLQSVSQGLFYSGELVLQGSLAGFGATRERVGDSFYVIIELL